MNHSHERRPVSRGRSDLPRHDELFNELCVATMELTVNVGIISSIADRWPEEVQDNWCDKLEEAITWARRQMGEVQEFATSWDE
jgi:hypothetical protein